MNNSQTLEYPTPEARDQSFDYISQRLEGVIAGGNSEWKESDKP